MVPNEKYCPYCGGHLDRYISVDHLSVILDCSPETIRDWIKRGKFGYSKFGRSVRIPWSEIEKFGEFHPSAEESINELLR
ncbi:MAG: helix-turn-helix domain-containing protein [Fidelibacterota bacterium]|nr:MAG: helix-turn-helix domain-containing protein [Candidatus Neomarinimicrobiota bacterium]